MTPRDVVAGVLMALPMARGASTGEPAPNIHGETLQQVAQRTGYTVDEIRRYFPPIQQWPVEPKPGKMASTFAKERFRPAPKPYVHPRGY